MLISRNLPGAPPSRKHCQKELAVVFTESCDCDDLLPTTAITRSLTTLNRLGGLGLRAWFMSLWSLWLHRPHTEHLVSSMLFISVLWEFSILLSLTLSQLSGVLWNNAHAFEQRKYSEKGKHCVLVSLALSCLLNKSPRFHFAPDPGNNVASPDYTSRAFSFSGLLGQLPFEIWG